MRLRLALLPMVALAALAAGCQSSTPTATPTTAAPDNGVAALSADEILAKAKAAIAEAKSFHVKGEATDEDGTTKLDMVIAGKNFKGTVAGALNFELIGLDGALYMKAPDSMWEGQVPQEALVLLRGKWVKLDASKPEFSGFTAFASADTLINPEGSITKGEQKVINGQPVIALVDSSGGTMYVATTGKPYPIQIAGPPGEGAFDFIEYDATVEITAPPAADVFDLSAFGG